MLAKPFSGLIERLIVDKASRGPRGWKHDEKDIGNRNALECVCACFLRFSR